jgi:2-polyprenyl-6-methoxyphenol hydroxylase-like FAD-dependent oxidoreductase
MSLRASVIVVGAGPTGMMLAIELGRRGISTLLVSSNVETSDSPKATVTQARTMEHFRRLGLAERIRGTGTPADNPTDIVYCSRVTWHELARHPLPSPNEARQLVREQPERWQTPELTHRSSQMWIEPILLEECRRLPSVTIRLGWHLDRFVESADAVTAEVTRLSDGGQDQWTATYLIGCDGASSVVRSQLGIARGESAGIREFKGRPMFSIHARAPRFFETVPFRKAWLFAAINSAQRGSCISLNGAEFKFSFWRPESWTSDSVSKADMAKAHAEMLGASCDFDVISYKFWRGGASLVADSYGGGRVFVAGDAAHLFTPSAGLGCNTGIDDAVNLGWKLAASLTGWGGPALLRSFEAECRPEAVRRTRFAAECAERLAVFKPSLALEQETVEGAQARAQAAAHFAVHLPFQYDIPGINFGARFDDSPVIAREDGDAAAPVPGEYIPSGRAGGRAPHAWLADGRALFDTFGPYFTLLRLGDDRGELAGFRNLCELRGVPLTVVELPEPRLRELYQSDLVLIRPDHMIAWRRRSGATDIERVLRTVTGWG